MQDYATSTDCILQNLTMAVENPSARCYANAPWRAFTWICATSTQPWGTLQTAVQESLDTAEAVDIMTLPGLKALWKEHDLNIQGDASHFVNSLWLYYRYAEIKEGGYLADHVQQPILVPYPDDWPGPHPAQLWKKGRPAFWEKMSVRINALHHSENNAVKQDLLNMIPSIAEHAADDLDQDNFCASLSFWVEHTHQDPQGLQDIIMAQEHQAHIGLALASSEEYKTWLAQAHSKGLRGLFRSLRQKDIPWQRPFQDLPLQERLQARQSQWGVVGCHMDAGR